MGNIDATIIKLKYETRDELEWAPLRYRMAKAGVAARFSDKINNCFLEIFSSKTDAPIIQGKVGRNKPITKYQKGFDQKKQNEFQINLDHLRGSARYGFIYIGRFQKVLFIAHGVTDLNFKRIMFLSHQ